MCIKEIKMDFKKFYDCKVKVRTTDGRMLIGDMIEYYYADQNENGKQSIVLDTMAYDEPVELYDDEIINIEVYE